MQTGSSSSGSLHRSDGTYPLMGHNSYVTLDEFFTLEEFGSVKLISKPGADRTIVITAKKINEGEYSYLEIKHYNNEESESFDGEYVEGDKITAGEYIIEVHSISSSGNKLKLVIKER